jgi:hypothetical protein
MNEKICFPRNAWGNPEKGYRIIGKHTRKEIVRIETYSGSIEPAAKTLQLK